jgi:hypothetical protein
LFYRFGKPIRLRCKYAAQAAKALEEMKGNGETTEDEGDAMEEEQRKRTARSGTVDDKDFEKREAGFGESSGDRQPGREDSTES